MLKVGLTGSIAVGKSFVCAVFRELGCHILDADQTAREVVRAGTEGFVRVVEIFGNGILLPSGELDRSKLGAIVFAEEKKRKLLNSIVHPKMFARMREMVQKLRGEGVRDPVVVEAAILIEANWQALFDEIWLVVASRERVVERIERDRGLKPEQTEARIRAQLSDEERQKHSTLVITNDGTFDELREKVTQLWRAALARSGPDA